jgi:hypothetical protein
MSETLERQVDLTLDTRNQRRRQYEAEIAQTERAIRDHHIEAELRQMKFQTEVRQLIRDAVATANHHMATRPEECEFCEVSGYLTGPLYMGVSACNPISYELRVNGQEVGETLVVELSHGGLIEASLGSLRPTMPEARSSRIDFGWHPIPLFQFNARSASDLVVRYLAAITKRWPLGRADAVR